ncbi:hypothetical protein PQ478_18940 [Alkalihalophilus pseudofirmus]|uniref:hypothetical protein n=1 Tax=Alkalihalophilus pseudofirmus TaxID=79885 RepID=UPI00259BB080|nr:hypothetical protein [Alkalihalophilus pseudofirmus]WEG16555.1 hypothetical protein PQ478_18940 [Alkalihalophilus pseudofirmus]
MKKLIVYLSYLIILGLAAYGFQRFFFIWVEMSRFRAADGPPGDITLIEKVYYGFGYPILFFLLFFYLAHRIVKSCKRNHIYLSKRILIATNSFIVIYLLVRFNLYLYDIVGW